MLNIVSIKRKKIFTLRDTAAILILLAIGSLILNGAENMNVPIIIAKTPLSLDYHNLPEYSLRTALRMLIAVIISLIFTLIYATTAAKNPRLERVLIPMLDILQSVPILGYLSFIITTCLALFPNNLLGVELASIFAIFTSQVWNMTFSVYQSLKTVPTDLNEAATIMKLSPVHKFLRLELPFATPGLVWNTMISMSGGWFFVVASEAITVGNTQYNLPGIGSYIALAIYDKNIHAVLYSIIAMAAVIITYDQLLFRPMLAWSEKLKYGNIQNNEPPTSWVLALFQKTKIARLVDICLTFVMRKLIRFSYKIMAFNKSYHLVAPQTKKQLQGLLWYLVLVVACLYGGIKLYIYFERHLTFAEVSKVVYLSSLTAIRVIFLIIIAVIFWTPIGIYIGLRPRLTTAIQPIIQFLSAFPVNLLFPIVVIGIDHYHLNPNIWLSPLMIIGTQWYILFNVIGGVAAFPSDLKEVCMNYSIKGFVFWRKIILPAILPYLVTGAITASGGAWNASIVSEIVNWGDTQLVAKGVGSYITQATVAGEFNKILLGIGMLSLFVVIFNKLIWRPLYKFAESRMKIDF